MCEWSKGGEVIVVNHDSLFLSLPSARLILYLSSLLRLFARLLSESESSQVLIKADSCGREFDSTLSISFAVFLVLFGLQNCQLLFLDPLGIDVSSSGRGSLLEVIVELNSFVFIVLFKGQSLGFFGLGFFRHLFDWGLSLGLRFLRSLFNILILIEVILDVADISFASSFFSGSVAK